MATDSIYTTRAGAYIEVEPADALRATVAGAYVEITRASGIRATSAGAYIELLSALLEDAAPILTARVDSPYEITLSVTYGGTEHLGFSWEKSADGSSWSVLGTTAADETAYRHYEPLTPATTYYYRVRAYRYSYGSYSDVVSATTLAVYQLSDGNIFWVDMEEADGTRLGPGPILSGVRWRYTQRLSRAGEWELEVPAGEPLLSYIGLKKYFHCYVMRKGARAWVGGGAIEEVRTALRGNSAPLLVFSGADILRELTADTVTFAIESTAAAPGDLGEFVINTLMADLVSLGWAYTLSGVTPDVTVRFVDESILGALVAVTNKTGQFFRLFPYLLDGRALLIASTPSNSNVVATNVAEPLAIERNLNACLILEIEKLQSSWELVNRLIVYGAGDGEARLTMAAATQWPDGSSLASPYTLDDVVGNSHTLAFDPLYNAILDTGSTVTYGVFTRPVKFKDIAPVTNSDADVAAAANVLVTAAVNELLSCALPQEHYSLRVAGLRKDVLPGQIIRVQARYVRDGVAPIDIDKDLIVLETQTEIDAGGARIVGLTVATTREFIKSDAEVLLQEVRQAVAMEAHPQMGPSENTISYREDIDDDYGAEFPFWLSNGTTLVNSITVRFKLDRLRSTIKNVAGSSTSTSSGGGTTATSSSGGGTTATSSSGGGSTPTTTSYAPVLNHAHGLEITDLTATGAPLYYDSAVGLNANLGTGDEVGGATNLVTLPLTHDHDVTVPDHDHDVTIPDHDHDVTIPDHTHDVTAAISAEYGIYEDPDAPYGVADLAWEINGSAISDTPTSIGGGWYAFDLTEDVSDPDTFRPLDSDNTLAVAVGTPTDKRVRVTVQIEIRTVIQSIAVV